MGGKEDVANPETIESVLSAETMSIMKAHERSERKPSMKNCRGCNFSLVKSNS